MSIAGEALPGLGRWELLPPAVSLQIQLCERWVHGPYVCVFVLPWEGRANTTETSRKRPPIKAFPSCACDRRRSETELKFWCASESDWAIG